MTSDDTVFLRTHSEGKPLSYGNRGSLQGEKLTGTLYGGLGVRRMISWGAMHWSVVSLSWTFLLQVKQTGRQVFSSNLSLSELSMVEQSQQ